MTLDFTPQKKKKIKKQLNPQIITIILMNDFSTMAFHFWFSTRHGANFYQQKKTPLPRSIPATKKQEVNTQTSLEHIKTTLEVRFSMGRV